MRSKEKTSSSESGIHFAHYIAGAQSYIISRYHALKNTIVLKRGSALDCWSIGFPVMLEKNPGVTLIEKLQAILLVGADSNVSYKEIFGNHMINVVISHGFMQEKICSEKGKTANDCSLAKVVLYDIFRQARTFAALRSIDAENCYDSIAHTIASLVFQAFGVPLGAVESMLTSIEEMKYFLRTAYGDSKNFAGGTIKLKFQGLCQGSGTAPAGWAVINIIILCAHLKKDMVATLCVLSLT